MAASLTSTDLTLDNTSGASIPGTPSAGQTVLYPKDDKLLYYKNDAGVEQKVSLGLASMVRLNTVNGYGSTNTKIRRFTNTVTNQGTDITYADSASLGATFTINTAGVYAVSYTDSFNTSTEAGLSLNSTQLATNLSLITYADILSVTSNTGVNWNAVSQFTGYLAAGAVIRPHTHGAGTGTLKTLFTITRVS